MRGVEAERASERGFLVGAGVAADREQRFQAAIIAIAGSGGHLAKARTSVVGIAVGNLRRILSVGAFGLVNVEPQRAKRLDVRRRNHRQRRTVIVEAEVGVPVIDQIDLVGNRDVVAVLVGARHFILQLHGAVARQKQLRHLVEQIVVGVLDGFELRQLTSWKLPPPVSTISMVNTVSPVPLASLPVIVVEVTLKRNRAAVGRLEIGGKQAALRRRGS